MADHEIVTLRCPSCGSVTNKVTRQMSFGAEFHCSHCRAISVLIVNSALVPLNILQQQGEKVCSECGRVASRDARFCQDGHNLVRTCLFHDCSREFPVDHQRCDHCGRVQPATAPRVGDVLNGNVSRIVDFGAYVELQNGLVGLVHISQISKNRVDEVSSELNLGQAVRVKVLEIDKSERIQLSIRDAD